MRTNRAKLLAATDTIFPEDDTRVRDATLDGINAVDGAPRPRTRSTRSWCSPTARTPPPTHSDDDVVQALERQREKETGQIRVFTIAYGSDPNEAELAEYAKASGGKSYKGGADDIESIYRSISSLLLIWTAVCQGGRRLAARGAVGVGRCGRGLAGRRGGRRSRLGRVSLICGGWVPHGLGSAWSAV